MPFIVWDRKNKTAIPKEGVFATSNEADAWIRRHRSKTSHKHVDAQTYDVVSVNVQS